MNILTKRQSIVVGWALSYFLIMLVPLIFAGMAYFAASSVIQAEITLSNQMLLERLQQDMDTLQRDMEALSLGITFDQQVDDVLDIGRDIRDSQYYLLFQATRRLRSLSVLYPQITDFWVYYRESGRIVSHRTSIPAKSYYQQLADQTRADDMAWQQHLDEISGGVFYRSDPLGFPAADGVMLAYAIPFPAFGSRSASAVCMIMVDASKLIDRLRLAGTSETGFTCILGSDDTILVSSRPLADTQWLTGIHADRTAYLEPVIIDQMSYTLMYRHTPGMRWHYASLIPEADFWQKASYVRNIALISLSLCLILGGLLTVYLLRRHYNPIRVLVNFFTDKTGSRPEGAVNEFEFLERAIHAEVEHNQAMNLLLEKQEHVLRDYFLTRLIKGEVKGDLSVNDALTAHQIDLHDHGLAVIAIYLKDYDDGPASQWSDDQPEDQNLITFIIHNVFSEILNRMGQTFLVDIDGVVIALVSPSDPEPGERLKAGLAEGEQFLRQYYGLRLILAVSNPAALLTLLPEAYRQAMETVDYAVMLGQDGILTYQDLSDSQARDICFLPVEQEHQLISMIQSGDADEANRLIDSIFEQTIQPDAMTAQAFRCLVYQLLGMLSRAVQALNIPVDSGFDDPLDSVKRLTTCQTLAGLHEELIVQVNRLCDAAQRQKVNHPIQRKVTQCIEASYADPNLSLSMIAEQLDLHPVYLSREYKAQAGTGLLDSINRYRVMQACRLLEQSRELTLEVIARQVGYINVRTFTRVFSKYEGIAPGRYRELHRQTI